MIGQHPHDPRPERPIGGIDFYKDRLEMRVLQDFDSLAYSKRQLIKKIMAYIWKVFQARVL